MPAFTNAVVRAITLERQGLQRILVERIPDAEPEPAYVLTEVIGPVVVGDEVVINTTAVDLGLGTGGWHPVHWNLSRSEWSSSGPGHIMKARYLSEQIDTGAAEEFVALPKSLDNMPVVVSLLHSQVAAIAVAAKSVAANIRIAYVMSDQAGLPYALSDLANALRERNLLDVSISAGQAFGADFEAVNVTSALGVAKAHHADVTIVAQGPGVVGTGSEFGFSGLECAAHLNAGKHYGAQPIFALRYSDADSRERHRGVSQQAMTVLRHTNDAVDIAVPDSYSNSDDFLHHKVMPVPVPDLEESFRRFGLDVTTMGRTLSQDRGFFDFAAAAGVLAAKSV